MMAISRRLMIGLMLLTVLVVGVGSVSAAACHEVVIVTEPAQIKDGRANAFDVAAAVAVYISNGYIDAYAINPANGQGSRVIHFAVADVPSQNPSAPQELASGVSPFTGGQISLYLLPDGKLQVNGQDNANKDYAFTWG